MHKCLNCGAPAPEERMVCDLCGTTGPLPGAAPHLPVGGRVSGYTVIGHVPAADGRPRYLARDAGGTPVWVREGPAGILDAEAAALNAVAHPAVVRVLGRLSENGRQFLVTEVADGVPLSQPGSLDCGRALDVALQLCEAAAAWHRAGYVYGRFTPPSIHYNPATGRIRLPEAPAPVSGGGYDAEADGPMVAGPESDVHAIALAVYRALAADSRVTLPLGPAVRPLAPLETIRPDLPPDFCQALGQALSQDEADRFQTPAALAGALSAVAAPLRLDAGWCTDRGSVRTNNQDCIYAAAISLGGGDRERASGGIFVCCDGMGGEAGGEIAAGLTAETVGGTIAAFLGTQLARQAAPNPAELEGAVLAALTRANRLVRERVRAEPALHGMGTTLTAAAVWGTAAVIVQVGDSRCYLQEEPGRLRQVTRDQSVVGQMVAAGQISAAEARQRPDRTLLYQAVGSREVLEPEVIHLSLAPGQRLLLVSDGVHGFLDDAEMAALLEQRHPPAGHANLLVNSAIARGSDDNCSAVVVSVLGRAG